MVRRYLQAADKEFDFDFRNFKTWLIVRQGRTPGVASDMCTYLRKALRLLAIQKPVAHLYTKFRALTEEMGDKSLRSKGSKALYMANLYLSRTKSFS